MTDVAPWSAANPGGGRAGRVIRDIVWATVARDQRDPGEAIAAWTTFTVSTDPPPPATSVSTAAATSSRQVATLGFRSPT